MNQTSRHPDRRSLLWISLLMLLLGTMPAMAQSECPRPNNGWLSCSTPWVPIPSNLWGELRPSDTTDTLTHAKSDASRRDVSNFNEFSGPEAAVPWFMSLDVENGTIFVAAGYRLQVWSATLPTNNTDPVVMSLQGEVKGQGGGLGNFPFLYQGESSTPLLDVDAPAGVDSVVAIVGYANMGISIVDTSQKASPQLLYQASSRSATEVYAARINGTDYAFMAQTTSDVAPTGSGLIVFNMTKALQNGRCHSPNETCPGVLIGRAGDRPASYVDGVGNYVAYSSASGGYQILDVSNPASAQVKLTGLTNKQVYGTAMWSEGGKYYMAHVTFEGANYLGYIYDVSCIASANGCPAGPTLLSTVPVRRGSAANFVTFSRALGKPFLHFGTDDFSGQRSYDREFLVDVSNPASPRVVSPPGYFSFTHNLNFVRPGRGKFNGQYFFRAAEGILDTHRLAGNLPPTADFSWSPAEVYLGTPVTFSDQSVGQPTSWSWAFPGGAPASATVAAPGAVTFSTLGPKSIGLTVGNAAGNSPLASKTLTVLDPKPVIGGVSVSQPSALVCQQVTLSSTGVTGKPALGYSWQILNAANGVMATGNQPSLAWTSAPSAGAGTYTGKLTVSNQDGTAENSVTFTLQALPTLRFVDASPKPTNDAFSAGTVKFHAPASEGATTWQWDFGDGQTLTTSDPVQGASPTHSYLIAGEKHVKVKIWNCVTGDVGGLTSQELVLPNVNPAPLKAQFNTEGCFLGSCLFRVNTAINFTDSSSGAQSWEYDWNGDGTFEDTGHTAPVTSHIYTAVSATGYKPALRVRRGAEVSDPYTVPRPIIISQGTVEQNPRVSVGGPSSGNVGQALSFTASSSNCTAAASGWAWSVGGGTGSSNTSTISITWTGAGVKTVSATNSGCGSTSGNVSVNITVPGG